MRIICYRSILIILACLIAGAGFTSRARASMPVSEANLQPGGDAYEINPDADGKLWVTDNVAGELWVINPVTGDYDVYEVGGSPVDSRHIGGYVWWSDFYTNTIGRVSTSSEDFTLWKVSVASGFYSTYLDAQGRFYAAELDDKYLYRLDPGLATDTLCTFTLPSSSPTRTWFSRYMTGAGDYLWVADWWGQLLRLNVKDYTATVWTLTTPGVEREPIGVALDAQGNVWYADDLKNVLGQLNPTTHQVASFAIPMHASATMVAVQSDYIWYSDELLPGFGRLDPSIASYTTFDPAHADLDLTPTCSTIPENKTGTINIRHGTLSWKNSGYPSIVNSDGWRIYTTPAGSAPWGIAVTNSGFVVDHGDNMLIRFPLVTFDVFLPVTRK